MCVGGNTGSPHLRESTSPGTVGPCFSGGLAPLGLRLPGSSNIPTFFMPPPPLPSVSHKHRAALPRVGDTGVLPQGGWRGSQPRNHGFQNAQRERQASCGTLTQWVDGTWVHSVVSSLKLHVGIIRAGD